MVIRKILKYSILEKHLDNKFEKMYFPKNINTYFKKHKKILNFKLN